MDTAKWTKLIEVVLYVINKKQGIDHYHLFKVLYFAEQQHLVNYGRRIAVEDFMALPYGPVPSSLYDAIKNNKLSEILVSEKDGNRILLNPLRESRESFLSVSDCKCLDAAIKEYASLSFEELMVRSHGSAWDEVRETTGLISSRAMAEEANASPELIAYIEEQEFLHKTLS